MPYVEPLSPKKVAAILGALTTAVSFLTWLGGQDVVKESPIASTIITFIGGVCALAIATFFGKKNVSPVVLIAVTLAAVLGCTAAAEAGLFGRWAARRQAAGKVAILPNVAARAMARSGYASAASYSGVASQAAVCQVMPDGSMVCNVAGPTAYEAPDVVESYAAAGIRQSRADRERRFNVGQRIVANRLEGNPELRAKFAAEWNRRYMEKIDPNNLATLFEVILKYLPQVLEILLKFI